MQAHTLCVLLFGTQLVHNITSLPYTWCKHTPCAIYLSAHTLRITLNHWYTPCASTHLVRFTFWYYATGTHLVWAHTFCVFPFGTHFVHNITLVAHTCTYLVLSHTLCIFPLDTHLVHNTHHQHTHCASTHLVRRTPWHIPCAYHYTSGTYLLETHCAYHHTSSTYLDPEHTLCISPLPHTLCITSHHKQTPCASTQLVHISRQHTLCIKSHNRRTPYFAHTKCRIF